MFNSYEYSTYYNFDSDYIELRPLGNIPSKKNVHLLFDSIV